LPTGTLLAARPDPVDVGDEGASAAGVAELAFVNEMADADGGGIGAEGPEDVLYRRI
jgi:hypothetical protein